MIILLMVLGLGGVLLLALQTTDVVRRVALNAMWGTLLLYPGLFAFLSDRPSSEGASGTSLSFLLPPLVQICHAIVISSCLVIMALRGKRSNDVGYDLRNVLVFYLAIQLAVILVHTSWDALGGWMVGALVLVVVFSAPESRWLVEQRIRWGLRFYVLASLVAAIVFPEWALVAEDSNSRELFGIQDRLIGFAGSSNYMGLISAMLLALELALLGKSRRGAVLFAVLAVAACLLSQSRTHLVAIALILILFIAKQSGLVSFHRPKVSALLVFLIAFSLFPLWLLIFGSFDTRYFFQEITTGRVSIWETAFSLFKESPLVGHGPSVFSSSFWESVSNPQVFANSHNQWIEALSRGGLVELLSLVCFLAFLLRLASRARATEFGFLVLALAVVIFTQLTFGTPFRTSGITWNLVLLGALLGIGAASIADAASRVELENAEGQENEAIGVRC